jgi:NAD(P)-dependent dehydrogenase (short-subunit alcohol dehydrogenase family)
MPRNRIEGHTALVTGANRGIGLAVTKALLDAGARKVYAGARRPETLNGLVEQYGERVVPVALDVTSEEQISAVAARATDVDLVINNAGIADYQNAAAFSGNGWIDAARREMETNAFGTYRVTEALVPALKANGGGIVANVISIAGWVNFPMFSSYSMSKAALHSLTQASRILLAGNGTQVLGIYPGPIDTEMSQGVPFEKATAESAAAAIVAGIENGDEEILTDSFAEDMGGLHARDPKALERQIAEMASQPAS